MILEVFHQGALGKVSQTEDLDYMSVNRVCALIRKLNRDIPETYEIGPKTIFRIINITNLAEEQRPLVYDMIEAELAQQQEEQQDAAVRD